MDDAARTALARRVVEAARLTGTFLLRSGATSDRYFDKYQLTARPDLLRDLAEAMAPLVGDDVDVLAGLEMGAIPLATMLGQVTGLPVVFVRKRAKEYGTCKLAEGGPVEGRRLLVVEDVVTSGGQVVLSTRDLRARGARVDRALCVIDRQAGGAERLAAEGIALTALFTRDELEAAAPASG